MGNSWGDVTGRGVKRPHPEDEAGGSPHVTSEGESSDSGELHTPKRKRFQSTSKYIVKKLFEEGVGSDVTIICLEKTWPLHKVYLSQCRYFDSMFNREWTESEKSTVTIEINDDNINSEALKIAFKSLYTDNIFVKPVEAVGVLAAASFLQLEPLIEHCKTVMTSCMTYKTVCSYYAASDCYGLLDIKDHCMTWLLQYFMSPGNAPMLVDISEELLEILLTSKDLWLLQVEVDVYALLKKWVFTQLHPSWSGNGEQLHKDANDFFKQQAAINKCCFLETPDGHQYINFFRHVRWMYVINDLSSIHLVKEDQIIPISWIDPLFKFCWTHHLKVEQGGDLGPERLSEEDFYKWAMRCGRVLPHDQQYHWRWLGYQYGLDLLFTFQNRMLTVKRNSGSLLLFNGSLSQQKHRHLMLRVKVAAVRKKDVCTTISVKSTDILNMSLLVDDEEFVMGLGQQMKFPLQITMHLLCIGPSLDEPVPSMVIPPPPVVVVPSMQSSFSESPPGDFGNCIGAEQGEKSNCGTGAGNTESQRRCESCVGRELPLNSFARSGGVSQREEVCGQENSLQSGTNNPADFNDGAMAGSSGSSLFGAVPEASQVGPRQAIDSSSGGQEEAISERCSASATAASPTPNVSYNLPCSSHSQSPARTSSPYSVAGPSSLSESSSCASANTLNVGVFPVGLVSSPSTTTGQTTQYLGSVQTRARLSRRGTLPRRGTVSRRGTSTRSCSLPKDSSL